MQSTTPLADPSLCHPVHRANDLLRRALLGSATATPDPAELWDDRMLRLEPVPAGLPGEARGIASLQSDAPNAMCQSFVIDIPDGTARQPSREGGPEGDEMLDYAVQHQLQTMVRAFHRRQRQASLLVACSILAALLLTLGGLVFLFTTTETSSDGGQAPASRTEPKTEPKVEQRTSAAPVSVEPIKVHTNDAAKSAPLRAELQETWSQQFVPSLAVTGSKTRTVLARPGQTSALGPLLPPGSARYLLLRGLPEGAALSAGRKTGPGTWLVKSEDVTGLALTFGAGTTGDYPAEVYFLGAEDGPQARQQLIVRVDASPELYSAHDAFGWRSAAGQTPVPQEPVPANLEVMHEQARHLLGQGNVPEARQLLTDLAERGVADAAYELALTYDQELLAKAGLQAIEGDTQIARAWYAYAARAGHTGASERLRALS